MKKILIVEDEEDIQELLKMCIRDRSNVAYNMKLIYHSYY